MNDRFAKVENMASHVREWVDNRIASAKLNVAEKVSRVISNMLARTIVLIVFVFFIGFASIALGYFLARVTGQLYWGFLIVAGIWLISGLMVWALREKMLRIPIMNRMLEQLFKNEEIADEED